ncbi:MAG: hypothetical protein LBQ19_00240 [Synergistaceae bacterium]|jgi:hypothetical protein|nr:hypothetical protein [Synergistaceae bacterium]
MESRSVPLLVGNKSYPLLTSLDDEKLKIVYGVLKDVVASTPGTFEQDQRLFIACIKLADALVNISTRLDGILSGLSGLPGDSKLPSEETVRRGE